MSKQRMINTRFWDDNYIDDLDPIEKLLFLYLLTNTSTSICVIYEIPLRKIASETGIEKEIVKKIIARFSKEGKVFYFEGWIFLKNFIKHQNQNSPKVQIGIKNELLAIPSHILDKMIGYGYPIDTISHSNLNLNLNSNLNINTKIPINKKIINQITEDMENFEYVPIGDNKKKKKVNIGKEKNDMLIAVCVMWVKKVHEALDYPQEDIPKKNLYHVVRLVWDREKQKWGYKHFEKLFDYFLADNRIKDEDKLAFDLCLSEKYVAKFKLAMRKKDNKPLTPMSVSDLKL